MTLSGTMCVVEFLIEKQSGPCYRSLVQFAIDRKCPNNLNTSVCNLCNLNTPSPSEQ